MMTVRQLSGAVALIGVALVGHASEDDQDLFSLSIEELLNVKIDVATKTPRPLSEVPASVSIYRRDDFRQLGVSTLAELLALVPGFQVHFDVITSGQIYYPVVRGSAGFGSDVQYLLNGRRLNNFHNNIAELFHRRLSLSNVERVEIVRGPNATLYGANALAGVVNIITSETLNEVSVQAGQHRFLSAQVNTSGDWNNLHYAVLAAASRDQGERFSSVFDRYQIANGETRDPREGHDLMLSLSQSAWQAHLRYTQRHQDEYYLFNGGIGDDRVRDETTTWLADFNYRQAWSTDTEIRYALSRIKSEWLALRFVAPQGSGAFLADNALIGPWLVNQTDALSVEANTQWSANSTLSYGFSHENGYSPQAGNYGNYRGTQYLGGFEQLESPRFVLDKSIIVNSVFVQDEWRLTPQWNLIVGARHDRFNRGGEATSPRLTVQQIGSEQSWHYTYSEAYKAPGLADLYNDSPNTVGNPSLKPSTVHSHEIQYRVHDEMWSASATFYHQHLLDAITIVPLANSNRTTRENVGEQMSHGIEFECLVQLNAAWQARFNYSRILANHFDLLPGQISPADFIAEQWGALIINYQHEKWSSSLQWQFTDTQPILSESTQQVVNANWRYIVAKNWTITLRISNALDSALSEAATGGGLGTDSNGNVVRELPLRSRQVYAGLDYQF